VNDELERFLKEEVLEYFKVITCHIPGEAEKNHENYNYEPKFKQRPY
jgi:hypothetical protein